jgi:hypothetical protein
MGPVMLNVGRIDQGDEDVDIEKKRPHNNSSRS